MLQELVVNRAGLVARRLELLRDPDDQRDVDALLVEPLLAAMQGLPVVSEEEDDRSVVEALVLQPLDHLADLDIKMLGSVEIQRDVLADHRMVRIEGRQRDVFRIHRRLIEAAELAVRLGEVDLRVERCSVGPLAPVAAVERLFHAEVEVGLAPDPQPGSGLAAIRREIASLAKQIGNGFDTCG